MSALGFALLALTLISGGWSALAFWQDARDPMSGAGFAAFLFGVICAAAFSLYIAIPFVAIISHWWFS